jgi:hypothetical protein
MLTFPTLGSLDGKPPKRIVMTSTRGCCGGRFVRGGELAHDPQSQVGVLSNFLPGVSSPSP